MKKTLLFTAMLFTTALSMGETITIYAPESMKWLEREFKEDFFNKTGDEIKFVGIKGLVPRLKLEKNNPKSDLVLGLTQISGEQAKVEGLLLPYKPENSSKISKPEFIMDRDWFLTPFDYGAMAVNFNRKTLTSPPKSFQDIKQMQKQLITIDPRSATGQELLLWSVAVYGENWKKFWEEMKPAILTVTSDWDDAFAKFSAGESPMMLGYATSNAYFYSEDGDMIYDSFIPEEGAYIYLEGAALTKKKNVKEGSKKFIEYLLTPEVQQKLVNSNYMLPVTDIQLQKAFQYIPTSDKIVTLDSSEAVKNLDRWKQELVDILSK
ncbi:MAG: thiamine ABC transporter substrate-binding protein [Fusobacteriaceae bacterium]